MRLTSYLRSVASKFSGRRTAAEMEEALRSHIEHRADDLERSGFSRAEAERRARIEFGGQARYQEESYEALGANFLEVLIQDLRFSLRILRKTPGFTAVAVATLSLAIGANALVFGVMNGLVLRTLNVPHAESLYGIEHGADHAMYISYPDYRDLRDRNRSFDGLAGFIVDEAALDTGASLTLSWMYAVSGNYFDVLGVRPLLGRVFHEADERGPNSAPYVVLSYGYWHTHLQDDRGVVGRVVRVNQHPFTIVGVMPQDFSGTTLIFAPDFYVPLVNQEQVEGQSTLEVRKGSLVSPVGRLKPGVSPQQASADLNSIGAYLERTYPKDHGATTYALARTELGGSFLGGPIKGFVAGLTLLAGLILLAACANMGSLFGARASDRSREVALRLALGASRSRVLRQVLTEAVLISLAGGAAGLWGSVVLLRTLSVWQPMPRFPVRPPVGPDASVYAIALALALVSGLLFGMVAVRQVLRVNPYQVVKAGPDSRIGRRLTVRDLLLAGQIAICAVLVTSSMVAVRGLVRSLHARFGFEPRNAMLVDTELNIAGYRGDGMPEMQKRMIEAVGTIPGVAAAGTVSRPPLALGSVHSPAFSDQTTDLRPSNAAFDAVSYLISPGYFEAAETALLAGRDLSWHDDRVAPRVAVVNRLFASKLFGSVSGALGGFYKLGDGARIQVVGVVQDGKYVSVAEDPRPAVFFPTVQSPQSETWLVVRSERDPRQLGAEIRSKLRSLDRGLPLYVQTWNQQMDSALFVPRAATVSLGTLGLIGAMLAITGVFGMAAYSVSKRLRELGIRIAVGARRKEVLQSALGRAVKLLAIGSLAGLLLGMMASRVLAFIVYQATPRDPLVLAGVVAAMLILGLLATWIPARRALSLDPLRLLREE